MDGATLRLLDSLRGVSYPGGPHTRSALEAFARLLFGWPLEPSENRWVEDLAALAELRWNGDRAEPFRIIYEEVRARGQRIDVSDDVLRGGAIALEGLTLLPLRERVAVATSCVLGFSHEEVGRIVSVEPEDAADVVNAAIAHLRHSWGIRTVSIQRRRQTPAA
jgi:hypothetical protein